MKQLTVCLCALVVLGLMVGGPSFAESEDITMEGGYVWQRRDGGIPGDLKAVFTPSGEGSWDVVFYFEWEGEDREWKGTASGSLTDGSLEGEAVEERDRKRTFKFSGEVTEGHFVGDHGAMRDGELQKRGTLELKLP